MTTPAERARALTWGQEVLTALGSHAAVDRTLQVEAANVLTSYPGPNVVAVWIMIGAALPHEAAQAIEKAGDLLRRMWLHEDLDPALRHALMYVLRHYPMPGAARSWARSRRPAAAWLELSGDHAEAY